MIDIRENLIIKLSNGISGYYYEFPLFSSTANSRHGYRTAMAAINAAILEANFLCLWYERVRVIGTLDKKTREWVRQFHGERMKRPEPFMEESDD